MKIEVYRTRPIPGGFFLVDDWPETVHENVGGIELTSVAISGNQGGERFFLPLDHNNYYYKLEND